MKLKYTIIAQITLLLLTVSAGTFLKMSPNGLIRVVHQAAGSFSGLFAIVSLYFLVRSKHTVQSLMLAVSAVVLCLVAGVAGKMLKHTASYQSVFLTMRLSGAAAFALSVWLYISYRKSISR